MNILDVFTYNQHFVAMMNIINNARLCHNKTGHKHHIIPRCWFKMMDLPIDNSKSNLVVLTPEEHLKVHQLAILCVKDDVMKSKMGFAVHRLLNGNFSGLKHTEETKALIKAKRALQVITDEHKQHISNSLKGKPKPERSKAHREALSKAMTGHKWEHEVIIQRGLSNRHPKANKANYQKAQKSLSVEFHKYKDDGGELKWQQWLHLRKESRNGEQL